jgi:hypothetical protein
MRTVCLLLVALLCLATVRAKAEDEPIYESGNAFLRQCVRLKLSGPTMIEATVWEDGCRIPVGTEFSRHGSFVCNPRMAAPNEPGCFRIESETKR